MVTHSQYRQSNARLLAMLYSAEDNVAVGPIYYKLSFYRLGLTKAVVKHIYEISNALMGSFKGFDHGINAICFK